MTDYRKILDAKKGELVHIKKWLAVAIEKKVELQESLETYEQAQVVIQNVAQQTQEELKYHVSELVTLALAAVFDDPYEFEMEFVQKHNQTECNLWFVRDGERIDPLEASGGGAVDVACFALRVCLWSLQNPKNNEVLILDEPLKWLKGGDLPEKGMRMIKEVSEKLGLQVLMISHIPDQIESADAVHSITLRKGVSFVTSTNQ